MIIIAAAALVWPLAARADPQQLDRAVAQESDVRVTADPQAWGARRADLDWTMTLVQVTIQNRSGKPLHLSYDEFVLVTPDGREYRPESPFRIDGSERSIATPMLEYDRQVEFRAHPDNAETGAQGATIAIPFVSGDQPG
ncbi:MAG TPA: hypothetical protein VF046_06645 [Gemmatimonadales bacterium]